MKKTIKKTPVQAGRKRTATVEHYQHLLSHQIKKMFDGKVLKKNEREGYKDRREIVGFGSSIIDRLEKCSIKHKRVL